MACRASSRADRPRRGQIPFAAAENLLRARPRGPSRPTGALRVATRPRVRGRHAQLAAPPNISRSARNSGARPDRAAPAPMTRRYARALSARLQHAPRAPAARPARPRPSAAPLAPGVTSPPTRGCAGQPPQPPGLQPPLYRRRDARAASLSPASIRALYKSFRCVHPRRFEAAVRLPPLQHERAPLPGPPRRQSLCETNQADATLPS